MRATSHPARIACLPLGCLALALLLLAICGAVAVAPAGAVTFASHADFATGTGAFSVAVGDFNGDGKQDLVVADYYANTVSVLLGHGDGSFAAKTDSGTGAGSNSIAVGDFNGDGRLDLATTNWVANTVSMLLGNGDGTFAAKTDIAAGYWPHWAAVGDVNGDGKQDLLVAYYGADIIGVLLGHGDGTFAAETDISLGTGPASVTAGDFNGDGKQDLATANMTADAVNVLLGNGDGSFAAQTAYTSGSHPYSVAAGDFNGDGKQDLVTANMTADTVSVLLGTGTGAFAAKNDYGIGHLPQAVVIGDFNGDGRQDVATANNGADTVSVLLGNGNGTFAATTDFATGSRPLSVATGDFNGDGKLDLAAANSGSGANTVSVLLNTGSPPAGSVSLDGGAAWSNSRSVTIDSAVIGATQMRFRDQSGAWSAWETYAATRSWTLPAGDGSKTVQAQYCNADATLTCSDSISLDTTPPDITVPVAELNMTLEAASPAGNVVNFHVTISDAVDPVPTLTMSPASGSAFPLGTTTVTVTGTDAAGNTATKTLKVTVKDTVAPNLTVPDDITAEATSAAGAVVDFTPTAIDTGDAHPAVTSVPASGSVFHLGYTTVVVTATDASGNIRTGTLKVWVRDTTPPTLTTPEDITAEATGSGGAHVSWAAVVGHDAVDGDVTAVCTPASGSLFALGDTAVNAVAIDAHGNATETSFQVTVVDTTAPHITVPADMTLEAASPAGNVVNFPVTVTDAVDPAPTVTITPASGSTFPLGTTTVTVTGTDAADNPATKTFKVTVVDTSHPDLIVPDDITAEATSAAGAAVDFTATATDTADAHPTVTAVPASGSVFPLGHTMVEVTATDASGNIMLKSFEVTVQDTTPPTLTTPDDITAEATGPGGAHVSWAAVVGHDAVDGDVTAVCTPASGSLFALGDTTVDVVAMDAHGNSDATTFRVTVVDTTAPTVDAGSDRTLDQLPGVATVEATLTGSADDLADPSPALSWYEGATKLGDGAGLTHAFALGEHTLTLVASDASGNSASANVTVTVRDRLAPSVSTSPVPDGWQAAPVSVDLTAADNLGGSGVEAIEYKLDHADWATGAHVLVDAEGVHTLKYRARDLAGNVSDEGSVTVSLDLTAPTVAVSGADDAWHNQPVSLLLSADDLASGVASLAYRVDGGDWVTGPASVASLTIDAPAEGANDGSHLVEYAATDLVGHESDVQSVLVNIDTSRPLTSAGWTVSVKRGQTAMLPYRVTDEGSPTARVTVRIVRSKARRALVAWSFTAPSDGRLRYTSFLCDLKPGTYRYSILATDEAGNPQVAADWKWLHVQ